MTGSGIERLYGLAPVTIGLAVLSLLLVLLVASAGADPRAAIVELAYGAFGERYLVAETVVTAIPLALVGLGVIPALRAGLFTIGSQGQLIAGAAVSVALIEAFSGFGAVALLAIGLIGGVCGGAFYALIPAFLRSRFSVNEILSTLLLNYIAAIGLVWLLKGPLATAAQTATPRSDALPDAAVIPLFMENTRLHWGIVLVPVLAALLLYWMRTGSRLKFDIFSTHPPLAARLGLSEHRAVYGTLIFSGVAAGLAGWVQVAGVTHTLYASVDGGLGFRGILVAVLGGLHPIGAVAAALFLAALSTGAQGVQLGTGVPAAIAIVAEGLILLFAAILFTRRKV
nr:ABC transporter permease [Rhizobium sp. ACO-34A]